MLKNQTVLVTGGAGKIGSAFCKGIINNGGKVIIGDISREQGMTLEENIQSNDIRCRLEYETVFEVEEVETQEEKCETVNE